mmetsp:Transcript_65880/g.148680  ORF Transcript_65880/g.148680 Transcript_65880/m.148680 type:complete len:101 (+) Transcript_65880:2-304(+)
MAYPVEKTLKWPRAKEYFRDNGAVQLKQATDSSAMDYDVESELAKLQATGKPIVLDSDSGHPPFAVMQGSRADLIELDLAHEKMGHPSTVTKFSCVSGCA